MGVQVVESFPQLFLGLLLREQHHGLEVDRKAVSEHRLDEHPQGFDVDPGDEAFTEVHFEPTELNKKGSVHQIISD